MSKECLSCFDSIKEHNKPIGVLCCSTPDICLECLENYNFRCLYCRQHVMRNYKYKGINTHKIYGYKQHSGVLYNEKNVILNTLNLERLLEMKNCIEAFDTSAFIFLPSFNIVKLFFHVSYKNNAQIRVLKTKNLMNKIRIFRFVQWVNAVDIVIKELLESTKTALNSEERILFLHEVIFSDIIVTFDLPEDILKEARNLYKAHHEGKLHIERSQQNKLFSLLCFVRRYCPEVVVVDNCNSNYAAYLFHNHDMKMILMRKIKFPGQEKRFYLETILRTLDITVKVSNEDRNLKNLMRIVRKAGIEVTPRLKLELRRLL